MVMLHIISYHLIISFTLKKKILLDFTRNSRLQYDRSYEQQITYQTNHRIILNLYLINVPTI